MTAPDPGRDADGDGHDAGTGPAASGPPPADPVAAGSAEPATGPPAAPAAGDARAVAPLLAEQSPEDTDAAWGEYPESARDRLYRDRPPHWDDV